MSRSQATQQKRSSKEPKPGDFISSSGATVIWQHSAIWPGAQLQKLVDRKDKLVGLVVRVEEPTELEPKSKVWILHSEGLLGYVFFHQAWRILSRGDPR